MICGRRKQSIVNRVHSGVPSSIWDRISLVRQQRSRLIGSHDEPMSETLPLSLSTAIWTKRQNPPRRFLTIWNDRLIVSELTRK
jgi:hypothetical protein